MTFGSGINGCLGHGNYEDVTTVTINNVLTCTPINNDIVCIRLARVGSKNTGI